MPDHGLARTANRLSAMTGLIDPALEASFWCGVSDTHLVWPSRQTSTATWIIQLLPGGRETATALPAAWAAA
jgi:hypothetical protein